MLDEETARGEGARVAVQNQALKLCGNGCAEKGYIVPQITLWSVVLMMCVWVRY